MLGETETETLLVFPSLCVSLDNALRASELVGSFWNFASSTSVASLTWSVFVNMHPVRVGLLRCCSCRQAGLLCRTLALAAEESMSFYCRIPVLLRSSTVAARNKVGANMTDGFPARRTVLGVRKSSHPRIADIGCIAPQSTRAGLKRTKCILPWEAYEELCASKADSALGGILVLYFMRHTGVYVHIYIYCIYTHT